MKVVLCWHMHQPEYRDLRSGEYRLPWTYLHAIKDYVDMVAHLEAHPQACAVVNFAPVLLDQIADYCAQLDAYFANGAALRDPLLATLVCSEFPDDSAERLALWKRLLRVNRARVIERFPAYAQLAAMVDVFEKNPAAIAYCNAQFSIDLSVWYHLGWLAETLRRSDARVEQLQQKAAQFTVADRHTLLTILHEAMRSIVPRYRALAVQGRVELAMSPYAHPIVPLLLDLRSAREALPDAPLPTAPQYAGGAQRAAWHIERGIAIFEQHFGMRPQGCWPSEGSVSSATLQALAAHGMRWFASGETVLRNSVAASQKIEHFEVPRDSLHRVYRVRDCGEIEGFFRDDTLSDKIGFVYADWHGDDAVANLVHDLEQIAARQTNPRDAVVSIILDGENAWEYYPHNGFYFLDALYKKLSAHPLLQLTTFSQVVSSSLPRVELPRLIAGSWVYGTFSTWIGSADKNRGWDLLCAAKHDYDAALARGTLSDAMRAKAEMQLAICEGSDWFWWFGDYNPAAAVSDFEQLFRLHLRNLYALIGVPMPASLQQIVSVGGGEPERGGVMLPGQEAH